jgi:hypothetical protein
MPEVEQLIAKRLSELPSDVQQAILSTDIGKKIQNIGATHGLHIDQLGILEDEVMLVMLGFADPNTFADNVVDHLRIPKETALQITDQIATSIFVPIRESMQAFMAKRAATNSASKQPPPAAAQNALTQPTITPAAPQAANPTYVADPYREPVE